MTTTTDARASREFLSLPFKIDCISRQGLTRGVADLFDAIVKNNTSVDNNDKDLHQL
jgi:hypothetical protein